MNRILFSHPTLATDTVNEAGGIAYALSNDMAILQLAVTGVFNDTYYSTGNTQLKALQNLLINASTTWIAQVAIYARQNGFMKDMPAYLVAYLSTRNEKDIFNYTFDKVIDNVGMVRSFVQMIRSGAVGRKSLGSSPKKAVARFLNNLSGDRIFFQCAGTEPSISDVLRLVHPKPKDTEHDALYGYLLGKLFEFSELPSTIRDFEDFKAGRSTTIPAVDFRRLTALPLTEEQWVEVGRRMTWNQLRLNLNTLGRHNCFNDKSFVEYVCTRLHDFEAVKRQKILPFALYNSISNCEPTVPNSVKLALGYCLDQSLLNAPELTERTLILVDSSGSMNSRITGETTTLTCVQAASYFAASMLKRNPDTVTIVPFDTGVHSVKINPRDSVEAMTNTLARSGGGTDVGCGIRWAQTQSSFKNIIIISDNESWFDGRGKSLFSSCTGAAEAWKSYKKKNPDSRLVCWDIQPVTSTQVKDDSSVLNIGGFTESAYQLIGNWFNYADRNTWSKLVQAIPVR